MPFAIDKEWISVCNMTLFLHDVTAFLVTRPLEFRWKNLLCSHNSYKRSYLSCIYRFTRVCNFVYRSQTLMYALLSVQWLDMFQLKSLQVQTDRLTFRVDASCNPTSKRWIIVLQELSIWIFENITTVQYILNEFCFQIIPTKNMFGFDL